TTDDPCDDLRYHKLLSQDDTVTFKVCPTFRPDSYVLLNEQSFEEKVEKLDAVTDGTITDLNSYINALKARVYYFDRQGAKRSDKSDEKVQ
ncbi:glucuronate isomerase, partial [Staphylococcus haemolyticus]|uniref:glucuronate isomerase n=1 Tax=Staphylococcus haemolyticus TaxID=1283 RepID=UPI000D41F541